MPLTPTTFNLTEEKHGTFENLKIITFDSRENERFELQVLFAAGEWDRIRIETFAKQVRAIALKASARRMA